MIISHKHQYLFVETPLTGSTAISAELREHYAGESILRKHSTFAEFFLQATEEERGYFVFTGVRNPLDMEYSRYVKMKNNHKQNFTTPERFQRNGGWISDEDLEKYAYIQSEEATYSRYLARYMKSVYRNIYHDNKSVYDYVMRFEGLEDSFAELLSKLGIDQVRPLPVVNRTSRKSSGNYIDAYSPEIRQKICSLWGPYMHDWGYILPEHWGVSGDRREYARFFICSRLAGLKRSRFFLKRKRLAGIIESGTKPIRKIMSK